MPKSPTSEKGYILAVPAIHNLPATQDLLLPVLHAGWKPQRRSGKAPTARQPALLRGTRR